MNSGFGASDPNPSEDIICNQGFDFGGALFLTKDLDSTSSSNSSSELKSRKLFVFEVALLLTTVLAFRAFRTASSEYKLSVVGDDLSFFTFCFFVRGPPSFED